MLYFLPLLVSPIFYFAFNDLVTFIFFVVGVLLAQLLFWFDQSKGYLYYAEPEKSVQLITRSPLFIFISLPMSLFVVTSSGSSLGMGIVLTIGMLQCLELWWWRNDIEVLNGRFYAHAQKPLTLPEFTWITRFLTAFFLVLSLMIYLS